MAVGDTGDETGEEVERPRSVPALIHQVWGLWDGPVIPPKYQAYVDEWRRRYPHYGHRIWGREDLLELIARFFPWLYERVVVLEGKERIVLADAARPVLMALYGGYYIDMDAAPGDPGRSLDELAGSAKPAMGQAHYENVLNAIFPLYSNYFVASPQGHPYWLLVLERMRGTIPTPAQTLRRRRELGAGKVELLNPVLFSIGPAFYNWTNYFVVAPHLRPNLCKCHGPRPLLLHMYDGKWKPGKNTILNL